MCGIVGALNWQPELNPTELNALTDAVLHRGPDDSGLWAGESVCLGFRRLAIIDLSPAGHQPMTNEDGSLWLVFNGEIYNYADLRAELIAHGHQFASQTDSECILHGYEQWGSAVVNRLRGMFAFALWDSRQKHLFLGRDRLGIKPLHIYWDGQRFAFASEIKALLTLPQADLTLDKSALWDYLTYLYIPHPKTAYQYIRQVPPGHTMLMRPGLMPELQPYWEIREWGAPLTQQAPHLADATQLPGWSAAVEQLRETLREVVRLHLIADVPVGSLLSGGIDSSAITGLAAQQLSQPIQTFSIGFDVAEHSELPYARIVAEKFGTLHFEQVVQASDAEQALQRMLQLYDQPFADASGIPTLAVSALAAEHVKVALSGDGGDEVFGGYKWYRRWFELDPADDWPNWMYRLVMPGLEALGGLPKVAGLVRAGDFDVRVQQGVDRYGALTRRIKRFQQVRLLPELAHEFREYDDYWHLRRYWRSDLDALSAMQFVDLKTYLPDDILAKVDRASMAVSLELRPPLLDHVLVEQVAALPPEFRFDKRVLRAAVADLLPESVLTRSKKGFSSPLLHWFKPQSVRGTRLGGIQLWAWQLLQQWQTQFK